MRTPTHLGLALALAFLLAPATHAQTLPPTGAAYGPNASAAQTAGALQQGARLEDLYRAGNPFVTRETLHLSPARCQQLIVAAPTPLRPQVSTRLCTLLHYHFAATLPTLPAHLPLPAAIPRTAWLPPGWSYWTNDDVLCSYFGCWYAGSDDWSDGDTNFHSVWAWHQQCTPSGLAVAGPCFVNFNGGFAPYYGLQLVDDFRICIGSGWLSFCVAHGQRRWIDDQGGLSTYYWW